MKDSIRIAMVSCAAPFGAVGENLDAMARHLDRLWMSGADIVCFPECSLTGYAVTGDAESLAGEIPGPLTRRIEGICAGRDLAAIAGLIERSGDSLFITQVVVGPKGLIGSYRKMHLSPAEKRIFSAGDDAPLFRWRGFSFGIGLCYDAHFPELASLYALAGADIIFYPHASPPPETAEEKISRWLRYLPARACDNGLYVAACNQAGDNGRGLVFRGASLIVGPKGEVIESSHGDDGAVAAADLGRDVLERVRLSGMGYFLKGRRPDAYGKLTGSQ